MPPGIGYGKRSIKKRAAPDSSPTEAQARPSLARPEPKDPLKKAARYTNPIRKIGKSAGRK